MLIRFIPVMGMVVITVCLTVWDRLENSSSVEVKVESVRHRCYGKSEKYDLFRKTTRTTDLMACDRLRRLVSLHPDFQDMTVYDQTYVGFHYVSPYDGRLHSGQAIRQVNDDGEPVKVNDEIAIRVRKFKLGDVRTY